MAVTIVPGPARMGMANGDTATLSSKGSSSSCLMLDFLDWSISKPMKNIIMPPNNLNAGMVSPKMKNIYLPMRMNEVTIIKATRVAVLEIRRFFSSESPCVVSKKIGMLTRGFMIAKNAINTVKE
jgi:hypothetical protein